MGYYLTTARNIVGGTGVTLDGENPTNGFHPLWLVILCILQALVGSHQDTMFHVALTVSALLFVLTGWFICQQIRHDAGAWLVAPLAGLFFFNYRLVSIPLGGLETALSGMTVVVVARFVSRWADFLNLKRAATLGGLLGLAYLARMDALLLGVIVLAWLAYRSFRMRSWQHFGLVFVCGGVSLVSLVPWFIFSWTAVHGWLPRSGEAILLWSPSLWSPPWSLERLGSAFRDTVINPAGNVANIVGLWPVINTDRISHSSAACVLLAALALFSCLAWRVRRDDAVKRLAWIPVYVFFLCVYYLQFASNIRYLYPAMLLLFIFFAVVLGAAVDRTASPSRWVARTHACVAVMLVIGTMAGVQAYRRGFAAGYWHRMHGAFYDDLAPWLARNTEPSARVGAFNAGILSYFSQRATVNLDGVMNDRAITALRTHHLCDYIDSQHIGYLADNHEAIEWFLDRDTSCAQSVWRARWNVVHRVAWPPDGGLGRMEYVVMKRK